MSNDLFTQFVNGSFTAPDGTKTALAELPWNPHPQFPGVYLKNIPSGPDPLNCLLVRIDPEQKIGLHNHPHSLELHEVIAGDGVCLSAGREIAYRPGSLALLPAATDHEVRAGKHGLCLFAKFVTVSG